ncbi:MAG: hypothetical protein EOO11_17305 [Chitinophagaceae bacterium]|nr:MAG: hypothetical protein EOO11_17305 [Chitinophagaceae bacterium]
MKHPCKFLQETEMVQVDFLCNRCFFSRILLRETAGSQIAPGLCPACFLLNDGRKNGCLRFGVVDLVILSAAKVLKIATRKVHVAWKISAGDVFAQAQRFLSHTHGSFAALNKIIVPSCRQRFSSALRMTRS